MRETKFRAWEKFLKQMIPVDNIDFEQKMINTDDMDDLYIPDDVEVIGNIYDNPELLVKT